MGFPRTIEQVVDVLNRATVKDRKAMAQLAAHQVQCDRLLADDKDIQVRVNEDSTFAVGMVGILNGLFGNKEDGYVARCYDDETGEFRGFKVMKENEVKHG